MAKSTTFTVRCTQDEKERWQSAAGEMKFNSWVKSALNVAAGDVPPAPAPRRRSKSSKTCDTPSGAYCYIHDTRHAQSVCQTVTVRHGEWSGDEFSQTFLHGKAAAVGNDAETSSDPHLLNVVRDMRSWLLLESVFCTCGDHPDSKDPYCLWCENDEVD